MAVAYRIALLDWLACAVGGAEEPATEAALAMADGLEGEVAAAGTAGHALDFDDTYTPGLAHLSAPVAPAAILFGAEREATVGEVISAYATGFEAMAQLSAANHPAMRERGWHPTSTCGAVGAAAAACELLDLDDERRRTALRLALLGTSGLRAAFGSDGKSLQVGAASAAGVRAAVLAAAGATAGPAVERGWENAYGARWVEPDPASDRAIHANWIKAYPCCLQTHGAIDAALAARENGDRPNTVTVHPVSLTAAEIEDPRDGLEAKFSIPYLTAYALMRGAPTVESFYELDAEVAEAARGLRVRTDPKLRESEAVLSAGRKRVAHVEAALGSPENPMTGYDLAVKIEQLAGDDLDGILDDPMRPASEVARILPGGGHHP